MLPALRRSAEADGDARIIMIGSIGGRIAGPMLGAYSAAKHGLVGLSWFAARGACAVQDQSGVDRTWRDRDTHLGSG